MAEETPGEKGNDVAAAPLAKPAPHDFWRHLPHFEGRGAPLFVTFSTKGRWELPPVARGLVLDHILREHPARLTLICAVVMQDHVHMLYVPQEDLDGNRYTKTEIVGTIKSVSAHSINQALKRKGPVWQDESFDHVTRRSESVEGKAQYISENPVRKGLCASPDDYPFLWRAWCDDSHVLEEGTSVGPPPSAVISAELTGEGAGPTL